MNTVKVSELIGKVLSGNDGVYEITSYNKYNKSFNVDELLFEDEEDMDKVTERISLLFTESDIKRLYHDNYGKNVKIDWEDYEG